MKSVFITILLLSTVSVYCQQPVFDKVVSEICDSLESTTDSLEYLSVNESKGIIISAILSNYSEWKSEFETYYKETGNDEYNFDQYFQHLLKVDCMEYRLIDEKLDNYIEDKGLLRELYLSTKYLVYNLEDNSEEKELLKFFENNLHNVSLSKDLKLASSTVQRYKRSTTLSIMMVYVNGYTVRVRYFDYRTDEPEFQMDVIYRDTSNVLIDSLVIKEKKVLMKELKERIEFNKKVESGELTLPPPPPPPPPGKGDG